MSKRPHKPNGIPGLFPYLTVQDAEKSIKFYEDAFGFKVSRQPAKNEQGNIQHAEMMFGNDVLIMFAPEGAWGSTRKAPKSMGVIPSLSLYIYCPDVDALYKQAVSKGAHSVMAPNDSFWGDRYCIILDPDGHEWSFATNVNDHKDHTS